MRGKTKKEKGVGNMAQKEAQKWELLSPEGVAEIVPMTVNPHPSTLTGKTVVLRKMGSITQTIFWKRWLNCWGRK
jgi:hypothetical protein